MFPLKELSIYLPNKAVFPSMTVPPINAIEIEISLLIEKIFSICSHFWIPLIKLSLLKELLILNIETFGIDNSADVLAKDITITNVSVDYKVKIEARNERIKVNIPGRFSVYNSLAAISVPQDLGASVDNIKEALKEISVPGRSELVSNSVDYPIMIDYAHTPDSLSCILSAVRAYTKGRVICVFGCGGDRDKEKRPRMGEVSGRVATYTIITTDNPRSEKPEDIIKEIEDGIIKTKGKYEIIVDRKEAIRKAILETMNKNDMVVICGKGHEKYQEINKEKIPFDEKAIILDALEEKLKDKN